MEGNRRVGALIYDVSKDTYNTYTRMYNDASKALLCRVCISVCMGALMQLCMHVCECGCTEDDTEVS